MSLSPERIDELMREHLETVSFVGERPDWRDELELDEEKELRTLGGPGSGNFGHGGRPGQIGGSSSSGGTLLGKPSSAFSVARPDGLDTRERFMKDGEYTAERQQLHREIIQHFLGETTPVDNPVATILGGGPASGKTTLVKAEGIGQTNTVHVDVDEIRKFLPEQREGIAVGDKSISAFTHEESSDISKALLLAAAGQKRNILLDGTA